MEKRLQGGQSPELEVPGPQGEQQWWPEDPRALARGSPGSPVACHGEKGLREVLWALPQAQPEGGVRVERQTAVRPSLEREAVLLQVAVE